MARPFGAINKATREVRELARDLTGRDPEYIANLRERLRKGTAGPIEVALWHLGYGKPSDHLHVTTSYADGDLDHLSYEQLAMEAEQLATDIRMIEVNEAVFEAQAAAAEAALLRRQLAAATGGKTDADGE
jgi:hypothetical protein